MEYISLKEASKITGYHPDYLSYLIRKKKIEGKRIGRDWFTTKEAIVNYLSEKKFLSIRKFLSSKIKAKTIFFLIGFLLLVAMGGLYFSSFKTQKELKTKANEIKEIRITNYTLEGEEIKGPVR
jgi:hypothetical protein